ncbi:MAG: glycosyltransferase [Candidatus Hydrothermarchaeales archaeon]
MRSVVVPTYNEEERIGPAIKALLELEDIEIIISDDGSKDRTLDVVKGFLKDNKNVALISEEHRGKGAALKRGLAACKGRILGFLDADLSAQPKELERLFDAVESRNVDIAIASRELPGSIIPVKQPFHRRLLGSAYSIIARTLFGVDVYDFQCGCKAFKREVWEGVEVKADGFVFDTELLAKANARGFRIKEMSITWRDDKRTNVNPIKDPLKMFLGLLKIKWQLMREKG